MNRARSIRVLTSTSVALVALVVAVAGLAVAQQRSPDRQPSTAPSTLATLLQQAPESPAETPVPEAAKSKKEFRGRLPMYYSRVVDNEQREKIYAIQREYAPKIDALQAQLEALTADRDEKVEAVLTPEQRNTVEKLRAAAKTKRGQGKAAESASE